MFIAFGPSAPVLLFCAASVVSVVPEYCSFSLGLLLMQALLLMQLLVILLLIKVDLNSLLFNCSLKTTTLIILYYRASVKKKMAMFFFILSWCFLVIFCEELKKYW